ncbi:hypothetical protein BC939DRAFT_530144 [Gamsiella multidivaricata]|uniref:uncharacterized protein n=1 Tax=Gamsiella multidivaricata TaxID=101098 RepID=UPI00221FED7A|nr:uncharacterized protein BC939DRAFT_530144 [Gamsiella multidivaricata]KAG0350918.1 hypothetical protein BGZ54_003530 [Gamsiella multidivaricata]KAI7821209.1 hypothetical protein BC939DRAFT_530144 [Gamsiella multidivaricata]
MPSVSPLDIPIIVDAICDNLDLNDIVSCKGVCKDWNNVFAPYEWRSLHLTNHNYNQIRPGPSPETRSLIIKHAHRLESLTIYQDDVAWLPDISSCVNIKRLSYEGGGFEFHESLDEFHQEFRNQLALLATRQNPKEQSCLEVDAPKVGIIFSPLTLFSALQGLSNLTELRLCFGIQWVSFGDQSPDLGVKFDPAVLALAMANCPSSLESFHIEDCFEDEIDTGPRAPPRIDSSTLVLPWKPLPNLRKFHYGPKLDYSCNYNTKDMIDATLIPFLRHCCPVLEDLSLPDFPEDSAELLMRTIGQHCPGVRYLRLNNDGTPGEPRGYEVYHFDHISQPLKFLKIDLQYEHDTKVLLTLMRNGPDALEALEFKHTGDYFGHEYIPPARSFPNLAKVDFTGSYRNSADTLYTWIRPAEISHYDDDERRRYSVKSTSGFYKIPDPIILI